MGNDDTLTSKRAINQTRQVSCVAQGYLRSKFCCMLNVLSVLDLKLQPLCMRTGGEVPPDAHPRHRGQCGRRLAAAGRGEGGQHAQHHPRSESPFPRNALLPHIAHSQESSSCDAEYCLGLGQTGDGDWRRCRARQGRARRPACCAWRMSCWGQTTGMPSWSSTPQTTGARRTYCGSGA